ncbi:MAG TPA: hypothetical protein VLF93_01210, partial [Candidatus Saccharimonadales bacterium]|nr:hypothetical protein [Candidatus Saccharimonadales bacterium]
MSLLPESRASTGGFTLPDSFMRADEHILRNFQAEKVLAALGRPPVTITEAYGYVDFDVLKKAQRAGRAMLEMPLCRRQMIRPGDLQLLHSGVYNIDNRYGGAQVSPPRGTDHTYYLILASEHGMHLGKVRDGILGANNTLNKTYSAIMSNENDKHFKFTVDGIEYDLRHGMTREVYRLFTLDSFARNMKNSVYRIPDVHEKPRSRGMSTISWKTWLTGEPNEESSKKALVAWMDPAISQRLPQFGTADKDYTDENYYGEFDTITFRPAI